MKNSFFITLFLFSLFSTTLSYSQALFRNYTSLRYNKDLIKNDEATARILAKQERQIARFIRFGDWHSHSSARTKATLFRN